MTTVFLDRDGVINENRPDYVKSWQEFCFLPGSRMAIARLTLAGCRIVVCTNQAGIASEKLSLATLEDIHRRMLANIRSCGGDIERIYYCPHGKYEGCACRKPQPGLLLQAQRELALQLEDAAFIGDSISDMQAAQAAGVASILVLTGRGQEELQKYEGDNPRPFLVVPNLQSAVDAIMQGVHLRDTITRTRVSLGRS